MERLNYTIVVVSAKEVKCISSIYFDSQQEAERYAEGITAGADLTGKQYGVMMLLNGEYDAHTAISKNMDNRKVQVYFRGYEWRKRTN